MSKIYNIRTLSMLGTSHSWAITMRSLLDGFIKNGHHCYLNSINGYEMVPEEWGPFLRRDIEAPDIDFCYTAPINFVNRFKNKSKLKMAIYNYETSILPAKWKDAYKYLDFVLPSSEFSKQVFINNGWPEEKCVVVPHGIFPEDFKNNAKETLVNDKPFRFLNVSIPHYRKNIPLLIEAYYDAFYGNQDVCLVIKTSLRSRGWRPKYLFECDVEHQLKLIQQRYISQGKKDLPQIEFFESHVKSMVPLYNSCQALVSASSAEGFGLPLLEGLAANMLVIAPNATGQIDFLNKKNSLLVDVKEQLADGRYQYWSVSKGATTYFPIKEHLSEQMLNAYENYQEHQENFKLERQRVLEKFTWENASKQIIRIADDSL